MSQNPIKNPENSKYTSITPSALALIKLKAYTKIPFARETATLLGHDSLGDNVKKNSRDFFRGLIHFENRYWTVDNMLAKVPTKNILEFSSGYSFRGLNLCLEQNVNFIDTDLPEVIEVKEKIVNTLLADAGRPLKGNLQLLPLNVLSKTDFVNVVAKFPTTGPVTIINEGLLVYFNDQEKRQLCSIIHDVLEKTDGYWITADIYIKTNEHLMDDPAVSAFRKEHHLDENRFDDFETAERFFKSCGFEILYRESLAIEQLSCLDLLSPAKKQEVIDKLKNSSQTRQTWCLKIAR